MVSQRDTGRNVKPVKDKLFHKFTEVNYSPSYHKGHVPTLVWESHPTQKKFSILLHIGKERPFHLVLDELLSKHFELRVKVVLTSH